MKYSIYFKNKVMQKRPYLQEKWIEYVLTNSEKTLTLSAKNRIYCRAFIKEAGKFLRVVTLGDGRTVHNAYFEKDEKQQGE